MNLFNFQIDIDYKFYDVTQKDSAFFNILVKKYLPHRFQNVQRVTNLDQNNSL